MADDAAAAVGDVESAPDDNVRAHDGGRGENYFVSQCSANKQYRVAAKTISQARMRQTDMLCIQAAILVTHNHKTKVKITGQSESFDDSRTRTV